MAAACDEQEQGLEDPWSERHELPVTQKQAFILVQQALVRLSGELQFKLRQSYRHLGKRAFVRQGRYRAAQQIKRARRETKRLRTYWGHTLGSKTM